MKYIISAVLLVLLCGSCGLFIQRSGIKNYKPKSVSTSNAHNKYQYDFLYLSKILEDGFPQLDSIFPKAKRQQEQAYILESLMMNPSELNFLIQTKRYLSNVKNQHTTIQLPVDYIRRPKPSLGTYQIPDHWVEYSTNDLEEGIDPYFEFVKTLIQQQNEEN